jgi:putative membrane protein
VTGGGQVETQPERTALAWQRSGLGIIGIGGLVGRHALRATSPLLLVVAGTTALLGLTVLGALAPVRYRRLQQQADGGRPIAAVPDLVRVVTALVVLTGVAALITVLSTTGLIG